MVFLRGFCSLFWPNNHKKDNSATTIARSSCSIPAAELGAISCRFRVSQKGGSFLLQDSHDDPAYNLQCGIILVFATQENLRLLMKAHMWFLDGTFKTAPNLYVINYLQF